VYCACADVDRKSAAHVCERLLRVRVARDRDVIAGSSAARTLTGRRVTYPALVLLLRRVLTKKQRQKLTKVEKRNGTGELTGGFQSNLAHGRIAPAIRHPYDRHTAR